VSDYTDHTPSKDDCCFDKDIAIVSCEKDLRAEFFPYLADWLGVPIASDALKSVAAVTAGMIVKSGIKYSTRAAVAGTWTAGVLGGMPSWMPQLLQRKLLQSRKGMIKPLPSIVSAPDSFMNIYV
jgi:hypothetical protein